MAETLLTFEQVISGLPDNTANLISPSDVRNAVLSVAPDAGEVGDESDWVLSLTDGVPQNINALSPAPNSEVLRGWAVDANNALIPDWGTIIVPSGLQRAISITFTAVFGIDTSQQRSLVFDLLRGSTIMASQNLTADLDGQAQQGVIFNAAELYEPALGEPWSVQVTSVGNSFTVDFSEWDLKTLGAIV